MGARESYLPCRVGPRLRMTIPQFEVVPWMGSMGMCDDGCTPADLESITVREAIQRAYKKRNPYHFDG
jgi:hypothetical protein